MVWYGPYGIEWYRMIWYGMIRYDMVWYGNSPIDHVTEQSVRARDMIENHLHGTTAHLHGLVPASRVLDMHPIIQNPEYGFGSCLRILIRTV